MNRFLFGACSLVLLFGCGARTESFTDIDGAGGLGQGAAGASNVAGAPPHKGGAPGFSGAPNFTAGSPGFAGSTTVTAGAPSVGGAPSVTAGAPSHGGTANVAGAPGIIQACQAIAGTACQDCLCATCSTQIVACASGLGCGLILACAQQTGCQGVACYRPQTCKSVIDRFGGLGGEALTDALSLFTCAAGSQSACGCN
jgi:hypothetical protein